MALSITVYHFVGCCYAECRNLFVLSVDMLNVVTPHYLLWVSGKKEIVTARSNHKDVRTHGGKCYD